MPKQVKTFDGVISDHELYTIDRFKRALGLTESAWRELRAREFPVCRDGKRGFISGRQAIAYFEGKASTAVVDEE